MKNHTFYISNSLYCNCLLLIRRDRIITNILKFDYC